MNTNDKPQAPAPRRDRAAGHSRRWLPYAGAIVLAGLIVAGLWPQPAPVETTVATVGVLRATVNEEGKTRIRQRYVVSSPVAGQLRRLAFKAGDEIHAGDTPVAVIEPARPTMLDARARSLAEARRDSASASLEKDRVAQAFAASELRRFEKLASDKTVSPQELEGAQFRESSAAKETSAAESALREAEAQLAEFVAVKPGGTNMLLDPVEIKAPAGGRVLKVFEENDRVVSAGTPLLEIGDPSDLEVVVEVLSRDGAVIVPGDKVEFEQWGGNEPLVGRVRLVEPAAFTKVSALGVEEQRVNVVADFVTPPEQRRGVGDNFRVEARIVVWEAERALKVPAGALFRHGQEWATFVVADGRARLRRVKIGRSSTTEVQVLEGIKEGETVILYPGSRIQDGQRIKPIQI
jgi:HlyD family secretion protein